MTKAAAQLKKTEGNNYFKNKQYAEAIQKYREAIIEDASDVTFYSNKSACHAALNEWEEASEDGRQCIITDKSFVKGYFRAALALQNLGNLEGSLDAVKRGLGIDSTNADLKRMSRELDEAMRVRRVDAAISAADNQLSLGDITTAFKTVDGALRLDPTNETLKKQMDKIKPQFEKQEKHRVSKLGPQEKLKEAGDQFFKNANFEKAAVEYTKCLAAISDKTSELALKVYNNRAACYKQLSNFDGTIEDSTQVLEFKPDDVKARMRRAQAYEACERYKSALQDVRHVLAYGVDNVGKASFDLANGMQHRLNRVIAQLKN
mmetsp:Transcript_20359/g.19669  ORF Transcript_20359/g.19669 Transcript_20359/m.19669 type:complete len:319 (+) Transcript_20359:42-998(+)|eukprot:CAMPEP_0119033286 /NCGR_PEP_ID=MMETSP1177-20130426/322_1 /TAXON_ID=2985 /ORGANISM="Ochromonas sp, Strain CCMP1899" /LENGTH=318 /DNA_ID=CAMNT_0006989915 /DNA_START=37 /DNA_END=993 /DNA_ORIENTATION=-